MKNISKKDRELIKEAKRVAKKFSRETWFSKTTHKKRKISTVGAALRTKKGTVYSGPNIYHPYSSPSSICAEYTVIAKAYSEGYRDIDTIVACWYKEKTNGDILPPCGQCRELLRLFGNPWIIIQTKNGPKKEKLSKLLPYEDDFQI